MTAPAQDGVAAGFADPVLGAQAAFRAVMAALARPGLLQPLEAAVAAPQPLTPELAVLALTLLDHDTALWLDPFLAASASVAAWLAFQTGAPRVRDPHQADFALLRDWADLPALSEFALGSDEYPDRSTTLIVALPSLVGGAPLTLVGPGIDGRVAFAPVGLAAGFARQWAGNRALFPRGVDLLLTAEGVVAGLPRSTRIQEG